jgi:hypothetical protein
MITVTELNRADVRAFLERQLALSYERVREVGGYQKGMLTSFFTFYTVVLTAVALADPTRISGIRSQLGQAAILLPFLVFVVGFGLYILYFNYELYIRRFKAHTKSVEFAFHELLSKERPDLSSFKLTYYATLPGHPPRLQTEIVYDNTLLQPLFITFVVNIGVVFLLGKVLGLEMPAVLCFLIFGAALHILLPIALIQRERQRSVISSKATQAEPTQSLEQVSVRSSTTAA